MGWTEAQQKVIDTRNKNLLVSAAAGSGKTAVLVERIITMISEGEQPLDIDHLLVVTFTNAAAAEMRERIGAAIDAKLKNDPGNLHLQKQMSLLQSAHITTIHSFCLNVIRNYFHTIDLDPSFKIAEESEMTLMKSDVVANLLERWYEEGREDFHSFIESYSYSKSDEPVEDLILKLYHFSMSDPWPRDWIEEKRNRFNINTLTEMNEAPWMRELLDYVKVVIQDLKTVNAKALSICNESGGPAAYIPALLSDRNLLERLSGAATYDDYAELFLNIAYDRLSGKREEGVLPWKKDQVKALREEVKKGIKDLGSQFFFQSPEEMLIDLMAVKKVMQVLFDLTLDFMEEFARKKEEKNLIDFNDLEHFALKILIEKEDLSKTNKTQEVSVKPTQAAKELSELFEEILIDEYQDSNMVQETILKSISREDLDCPNRFMVGDVKQSIYKFRLAMPEIFMEKYEKYGSNEFADDSQVNMYQRIDLDKNFRSRWQVLDYVNIIFEQIMQKSVGGIIYDNAASLKYGETYDNIPVEAIDDKRLASEVELLLVTEEVLDSSQGEDEDPSLATDLIASSMDKSGEAAAEHRNEEESLEEEAYTKKELEARVIAKRIKELTDPKQGMLVFDKKTKGYRPANNRDIVILLRSMTGWSEVFVETLTREGIAAHADTGTGYFQTLEIMTILNMLRIIDNPLQDIPFTGVLHSSMVGVTNTELAKIRAAYRNVGMYRAATSYAVEGSDPQLKVKLSDFLEQLKMFRSMVNYIPIHEIIERVFDVTGYYYYVSTLQGGSQRAANIEMLISQAVHFEKGSYSGLFHFIRYIEKLHKYEVDFGEAVTSGEQDNTVRIMSIHKSKGLEFPIVFVAGMGKQFNTQDLRNSIVLHSELGVGPEYIDDKVRTKVPTLPKKVIQKKVQIENLGEELRVLYVALTRAREKLIMTGYLKSPEDMKRKDFTFYELLSSKCYLDLVLPAMLNRMETCHDSEVTDWNQKSDTTANGTSSMEWKKDYMNIKVIPHTELLKEEITKQVSIELDRQVLAQLSTQETYDSNLKEEIKTRFHFVYPYKKDAGLKVKMSVSELKKLGQFTDEELSEIVYQPMQTEELKEEYLPDFIRQKEPALTGTDRGTLYHKVLELLDLTKVHTKEELKLELEQMVEANRIKEQDVGKLKLDYIYTFATSSIADRMRLAQMGGKLYKEKQFVMGIKAAEVNPELASDEIILIQGIIDAFLEEDGELVLVDYKSDLITKEEQLISRYKVQLEYYRKALEQIFKKPVKEMILYSLPLGKEIRIVD